MKELSRHFSSKESRCTVQELHVRSEGEEIWGIKAHLVFFLFITEVLVFRKSAFDRDCQEATAQVQASSGAQTNTTTKGVQGIFLSCSDVFRQLCNQRVWNKRTQCPKERNALDLVPRGLDLAISLLKLKAIPRVDYSWPQPLSGQVFPKHRAENLHFILLSYCVHDTV